MIFYPNRFRFGKEIPPLFLIYGNLRLVESWGRFTQMIGYWFSHKISLKKRFGRMYHPLPSNIDSNGCFCHCHACFFVRGRFLWAVGLLDTRNSSRAWGVLGFFKQTHEGPRCSILELAMNHNEIRFSLHKIVYLKRMNDAKKVIHSWSLTVCSRCRIPPQRSGMRLKWKNGSWNSTAPIALGGPRRAKVVCCRKHCKRIVIAMAPGREVGLRMTQGTPGDGHGRRIGEEKVEDLEYGMQLEVRLPWSSLVKSSQEWLWSLKRKIFSVQVGESVIDQLQHVTLPSLKLTARPWK